MSPNGGTNSYKFSCCCIGFLLMTQVQTQYIAMQVSLCRDTSWILLSFVLSRFLAYGPTWNGRVGNGGTDSQTRVVSFAIVSCVWPNWNWRYVSAGPPMDSFSRLCILISSLPDWTLKISHCCAQRGTNARHCSRLRCPTSKLISQNHAILFLSTIPPPQTPHQWIHTNQSYPVNQMQWIKF